MIPRDPPPELPVSPTIEPAAEPRPAETFWSWLDVAVFISFGIVSVLLTGGALLALRAANIFTFATQLVLAQCLLYALLLAALYLIIRGRYSAPFWWSMGFRRGRGSWVIWAAGGAFLAIVLGALGVLLRAPNIQLPFEDLLRGPSAVISLGILVVLLGPFCEELVFRGFLMPLFIRSLGAVAGILLAAVLFGAMHAPEYHTAWQQVVLITAAGAVFGWARYRSGSTFPAMAMHAGFNCIQFVLFLAFQNPASK